LSNKEVTSLSTIIGKEKTYEQNIGKYLDYLRDYDWGRDACHASHLCRNRFHVYSCSTCSFMDSAHL
jgi:hypothetical protein